MSVEIIRAPGLAAEGIAHGFLTRRGGASSGLYESLNCGRGSDDDPAAVAENRARAATALGFAPGALVGVHQIHSAIVHTVGAPGAPERADALVTDRPGVLLSVLSADCAPVLMADPKAGVVGAAHAGWRGASGGVIEAALEAMERLGARRGRVLAAIGPTIGPAAYEVGPDFAEALLRIDPRAAPRLAPGPSGRAHFDLPAYALMRLRAAGVASASWTGHCTYAGEARFYSYRRTTHRGEADYGRLISAIGLRAR